MILRKFTFLMIVSFLIMSNFTAVEARHSASFGVYDGHGDIAIKAIIENTNKRLSADCKLYVLDKDKWRSCKAYFGNSTSNQFIAKSVKDASNVLSSIEIVCSKKEDSEKFRKVVSATISAILGEQRSSNMKSKFEQAFYYTNKELPYKKTFTSNYVDIKDIVLEYKVSSSYVQSVKITAEWTD